MRSREEDGHYFDDRSLVYHRSRPVPLLFFQGHGRTRNRTTFFNVASLPIVFRFVSFGLFIGEVLCLLKTEIVEGTFYLFFIPYFLGLLFMMSHMWKLGKRKLSHLKLKEKNER